ncbi:MAG: hypothetical protein JO343_09030 [Candidatus Eremiobacteraeota bacterium]|nr:hypothetical protein [Candidatus Eremiobacteraeota bacterium]
MTVSQQIEMPLTGREQSTGPGDMVASLLGVEPKGESERETFSNLVHWTWGTLWGLPRGLISLTGAKGGKATVAHALIILGTDFWILHKFGKRPPPWRWARKELAIEVLHKSVLALATGLVYDTLEYNSPL